MASDSNTNWEIDVGNPYRRLLNPQPCCNEINRFARTGFRRSLANHPWYLDAKAGHIVVSERDSHRLQLFDLLGRETKYQPQGCYGYKPGQFISPAGVTTTRHLGAEVIVADTGNKRIQLFKNNADFQGNGILQPTVSFGQQVFQRPHGIEFDPLRDCVVVTDTGLNNVILYNIVTGQKVGEVQQPASNPLMLPLDVTLDTSGRIYVTDAGSGCVHFYDRGGQLINIFGFGKMSKPWGICFDRQDNLLISDELTGSILMYRPDGTLNRVVTNEMYLPKGISVNQYEMLCVATSDPYDFVKIIQYK